MLTDSIKQLAVFIDLEINYITKMCLNLKQFMLLQVL